MSDLRNKFIETILQQIKDQTPWDIFDVDEDETYLDLDEDAEVFGLSMELEVPTFGWTVYLYLCIFDDKVELRIGDIFHPDQEHYKWLRENPEEGLLGDYLLADPQTIESLLEDVKDNVPCVYSKRQKKPTY